jgi:hypothetical protein
MKKLVFAFQVFGLLAMFPIVVILEMNHVTGTAPKNNFNSRVILKTEKTKILPGIPAETIFFTIVF